MPENGNPILSTMLSSCSGGMSAPDCLLDEIEQAGRFLDARARLGAHMHQDLPGIDRRKEVLAEERPQPEGTDHDSDKAGDHGLGVAQGNQEQRAVTAANQRKHLLEAHLKPLQRIA